MCKIRGVVRIALTAMFQAFAVAAISALAWASLGAAPPLGERAGGQAQGVGAINGVASTTQGQTLANITVQLRDLATGQIAGTTTTTAAGNFSFVALNPSNYVIELTNLAGEVVTTSASITVTAGAIVSGVTVSVPAALIGAAAGAAGGVAAAGAGAAGSAAAAAASTAVAVTSAAAAAGLAGAVAAATTPPASPSR